MISSLTGQLHSFSGDDRVQLRVGPFTFELLVPAIDVPQLQQSLGESITFFTILHIQSDGGNSFEPQMIGFLRQNDRQFFELFVTVKGVGPKTALRALTIPPAEIAHAIERKDARRLQGLKGIGKRTAELMIAELSGKVSPFAIGIAPATDSARAGAIRLHTPVEEDAIDALIALGERRGDAEALLTRVRQATPEVKSSDALVREMLRLRTAR